MERHQNQPINRLLSFITAISLLFIVACGGSRINMRPVLKASAQNDPTKGIVVARFVNAGPYPLPFNYMTITPENFNASKDVKEDRLEALTDFSKGNSIFASEIKPGKYALSDLYSLFYFGDYSYRRFLSTDAKFGTFQVESGKVTDLGTIIYYPKPQGDRYVDVMIRIPNNEAGEILAVHFPFYQYADSEVLSWDDDGRDEERSSIFASIAQNPIVFDHQYLGPDGSLYFLAKLGIILKRTVAGEWEVDGVDTNLMLTSIASNANGDVFVGGVEGALYRKLAGSDEWEDISLSHQNTIAHLSFSDEQNINLVSFDKYNIRVQRANAHSQSISWQSLNAFNTSSGWQEKNSAANVYQKPESKKSLRKSGNSNSAKQKISYVNVTKVMDQHLMYVGTKKDFEGSDFSASNNSIYSYQPESWAISKYRDKSDISNIIDAGNGKIGIEEPGFWSWSGLPSYYHYDTDKNDWVEINTRAFTCGNKLSNSSSCKKASLRRTVSFKLGGLPYFFDNKKGIVVANFSSTSFISANNDKVKFILKTEDGGKTWSDTGYELPSKYCSSIVPQVKDRLIISCRGISSDFYESTDGGASWSHVRQHENF